MKKSVFSSLLRLRLGALLLLSLLFSGGLAQAYLCPVNPLAGDGNPAYETAVSKLTTSQCGSRGYTAGDGKSYIGPGNPYPDYLTTPNWAYTQPLRKFVDPLPELCDPRVTNCDANYPVGGTAGTTLPAKNIPIAVPDIVTYPGSDYYEIELVQFQERMHSDLQPTTLRGYRQVGYGTDTTTGCTDPALGQAKPCTPAHNTVNFTTSKAHYLGPLIVAQKDRPVRLKFINKLPVGAGGDLFLPVDQTIMGAGDFQIDFNIDTKEETTATSGTFTQNRGEIHLHGGRTPWISDGTPHQWITPANDPAAAKYPKGVSVVNVPDMPDPGAGAQTYYYTNQQSSRLLFYHDHTWGLTRLNVYAGGSAGYLIQDEIEAKMLDEGILPLEQIPLIIQDKTFVDARTIGETDPTWIWGTTAPAPHSGDLWWPHVYMPAQNPYDISGVAPMGRWAYGPYFWPATANPYQPVDNPYYNANCEVTDPAQNVGNTPGYTLVNGVPHCQQPMIPSTPNPSWGAEAFLDTPLVNGTAYPVLTIEPKAYRFRVLNASHDRFYNLSLFEADTTVNPNVKGSDDPITPMDEATLTGLSAPVCATLGGCAQGTEVRMLPATTLPLMPPTWPADGRDGGFPDWNYAGPEWIMIGSESGFLPRPVVIPPQPVTWNNDVTTFNAGNVNGGSLIVSAAERADVIVDFSAYAGKTLILYNDAPAPWPALDPHYDYFTGAPDMTDAGGAPTPLPGLGPNTRTIMKIVVAGSASSPSTKTGTFSRNNLEQAFAGTLNGSSFANHNGVFRQGQDPIIVGQGNFLPDGDPTHYEAFPFDAYGTAYDYSQYNTVYNTTFPSSYPNWGISRINDKSISFRMVNPDGTINPTFQTVDMKTKAIQDEQGETFDDYGRMRAGLGLELINPGNKQVNFIIQTYSDPSTEILEQNGLQVWKITHNGVDTHPVHFHLYDVQVLNRVGWDGFIRIPDPTEQGWKDTLRVSPLEDTIVALRPITPRVPFGVPESIRPLNPARPAFAQDQTELTQIDPYTGQAYLTPLVNQVVNVDWEYVWHCHILSHEENDMMRNQSYLFLETKPAKPAYSTTAVTALYNGAAVKLTWPDPTPASSASTYGNPQNEIGFRVWRATQSRFGGVGTYSVIGTTLANATSYYDTTASTGTTYYYRVNPFNAANVTASTTNDNNYFQRSATQTYSVSINPANPSAVSSVTLAASPASSQKSGTFITFTAAASGGSGDYAYQYSLSSNGGTSYTIKQAYSATATWTWNTTGLAGGSYVIKVDTRNAGSTAATQANRTLTYVLTVPTPASAVTLTPSPASPQFPGTTVGFAAAASGGSGAYEYQFSLTPPSGTASVVQSWSTASSWDWATTALTPGTYTVAVSARNAGSSDTPATNSLTYTLSSPGIPAVTGVTLTPSQSSPQNTGTAVTFTASASGGVTPYQYQFTVTAPGGTATVVQSWSTTATWTLANTSPAGAYSVKVDARSAGSASTSEASATVNYTLTTPGIPSVTSVSLTPSQSSPQVAGTAVTFTAAASGGVTPYQYQFTLTDNTGTSVVQTWSATATWTLAATRAAGTYTVKVDARSAGSSSTSEATNSLTYVLSIPAVTGVTLTPSLTSPQVAGTAVTFTAAASGGVTPYQYQFTLTDNTGTSVVQTWSAIANWTLAATRAAGTYTVKVDARSAGSSSTSEATNSLTYVLSIPAVTGVTLTPSLSSPQIAATAVTFTAAASGGATPYQYQFTVTNPGGSPTVVQAWSTNAVWTLVNTSPAGIYTVTVDARSAGSSSSSEATSSLSYTLTAPSGMYVTLTPNLASPQVRGTSILFTAKAGGGKTLSYEYMFLLKAPIGSAFSTVRSYSATSTWTWNTTGLATGTYQVMVYARAKGSLAAFQASQVIDYTLTDTSGAANAVLLTPNLTSPQTTGTAVTFTAAASGGVTPYQYQFTVTDPGGTAEVIQTWSNTATWTLANTSPAGAYTIKVDARSAGSASNSEASATAVYTLTAPVIPVSSVSLTPSLSSPQTTGNAVTFTAAASGGTTPYQYQFTVTTPGGTPEVIQTWSNTATWTLPNTSPAGTYTVVVDARSAGSSSTSEATRSLSYVLSVPVVPPVNDVTLTPSLSSPRTAGTAVTFTAAASGGATPYQYQFTVTAPGGTATVVQAYSTTATWTLANTSPAGIYTVKVDARSAGSSSTSEATSSLSYTISAPTGMVVTLTPNLGSPQVRGTSILFTAKASGGNTLSYEYMFLLKTPIGSSFTTVRSYSTTATWTWNTASVAAGTYQVMVYARKKGSLAAYEATQTIDYTLTN